MICRFSVAAAAMAAAFSLEARVLPKTLILPQCEFYPLREQDRGYLYRYTDQPLLLDSDLPEDPPHPKFETRRHRFWGEWFSQADWNRAQEIGKDCGFDGFGFFPRPHRVRYWDAMEVSPVGDFLSVPIAHNYSTDGSDLSKWFGYAVKSTKGYRVNGKALILSYRFANSNPPERLKMKLERMRREFGDTFLFVCDISKILNPDEALEKGRLSDETVAKHRELVRSYLRVCDGVMVGDGFSVMKFDRDERVFFSGHYRQIVKLIKDTVEEPEFKGRKLFGLAAVITHQNPTVEFWTANEDGLRTLTESLRIACEAEPDVILLPEWDEFNENSCVGPTLANGYSVKRVLRYCRSRLEKTALSPCAGDDVSLPNLIVSYRRNVSPGERLEVDVLNVPDGARSGPLEVRVEILGADGTPLERFSARSTDENELRHLRFPVDSAALSERTRAARVLVEWKKDGKIRSVGSGLHPIDLSPANGWCKKEIHQPLRDLAPVEADGGVAFSGGRMRADIKCFEPLRYAFVCGNGQIQHVEGKGGAACGFREDGSNAVFAVSGISPDFIDLKKFSYRITGASEARWLDRKGVHAGLRYDTDWLTKVGDPYYVRLPLRDVERAVLEIDFGKVFRGAVPLSVAFKEGAYALGGAKGVQFTVTRFRRQCRYPSAADDRRIVMDVPVDADRPSMMYHVQAVTMSGKTWRSAPFVAEPPSTAKKTMKVKSAFDGTLRTVALPGSRVPLIAHDLSAGTGTFLPAKDRFLHFATVLGGEYSPATLWNRSSAGATDGPLGIWPDWAKVESSAPVRTAEADRGMSLSFDGADDFVLFPWESVPQNSAYRISFSMLPMETAGKIALFRSKSLLNVDIENGILHVQAAGLRRTSTGLGISGGRWHDIELSHEGDAFKVSVDGKIFSAPAKLPSIFMSPVAFGLPLRGTKDKPFKGRIRDLVFDHSCPSAASLP